MVNEYFDIKALKMKLVEYDEDLKDVAKILNRTLAAVYNKMKGASPFTYDEAAILANHFNIEITYFLKQN